MRILTTILFTILSTGTFAQVKISGVAKDNKGEPIPGANIFLRDTYDGTSSNEEGKFEFETSEKGTKVLIATFIGYEEFTKEIQLENSNLVLSVILKEKINELEAVTISAGAFTANDVSRRTIFRALDIATTAGATADIAGALNTLPGTQKVGESGRLFVRGGDGNETRTFIDGLVVLDAYSPSAPNTPSRGRFLPFMFKGTSFSTGGYSAEYGQALSSALVLDSKDKSELTRTDIGILSVGGDVGHTQVWDRGSVAGKIQYTNVRPYVGFVQQEIDWKNGPMSLEGSAAFRQEVGKGGMLKFYGNFNNSDFSLYRHDIVDPNKKELYELKNNYRYLNAFYKDNLNENWSIRGGMSYTQLQNDSRLESKSIDDLQKGLHIKAAIEGSLSDHIEVKAGSEIITRSYHQSIHAVDDRVDSFEETIAAPFIEADMYASEKFVVRTGLRSEYNNLINEFSIDPRISLAYKTGSYAQVSLASGRFRQTAKNEFVAINNNLNPESASHYILNYQYIKEGRTFRIETYYKAYADLVKYDNNDIQTISNEGNGDAKGIELFWRDNKSIRELDYWISYSYLDTKRNYLNYPTASTPSFASRHNFSAVTKYFFRKIKSQVGLTYSFTSGRPYNNPNAEIFNSGKTPNYSDLSINVSYLPSPAIIVHFSCTNILGRDNVFGYEYATSPDSEGFYNGRAIRQPAPRFLFLGIFITLSKNKSANQLRDL
jgi:outer membrane cobalamin receptor